MVLYILYKLYSSWFVFGILLFKDPVIGSFSSGYSSESRSVYLTEVVIGSHCFGARSQVTVGKLGIVARGIFFKCQF